VADLGTKLAFGKAHTARFDVICVGRAAVDLYAEQLGSGLEDASTFAKYLGGSAANTCAACHARRSTLVEHGATGAPLLDTHRPALLTPPTYFADGQQRDEVFVWNSYLQTRMHQKGVTCMDCHDAHSLKLQIDGNTRTLPTRCFRRPSTTGTAGKRAPGASNATAGATTWWSARRDHAIRVPR
jgi:hypothetical protein